jgi:hypothetical protein
MNLSGGKPGAAHVAAAMFKEARGVCLAVDGIAVWELVFFCDPSRAAPCDESESDPETVG